MENETVSLIPCAAYDFSALTGVITRHFENMGGLDRLVPAGCRVVIKPNLVMGKDPARGATTHPEFLRALISVLKARTENILIAESPGGPGGEARFRSVCRASGICDIGCEILFEGEIAEVPCPGGVKGKKISVLKAVAEADLVISAAKLKTHGMMTYTGAAKNMFGAVYGLEKSEYHFRYPKTEDFAEFLVDLCTAVRPQISFIDGIIGMEGNGPTGGDTVHAGLTFAGRNPFALDAVAGEAIGIPVAENPLIFAAAKRNLWSGDVSAISLLGKDGELIPSLSVYSHPFRRPDSVDGMQFSGFRFVPRPVQKFLKKNCTPYPSVKKDRCVGCGECAASCPKKIIRIARGKALIDLKKGCISCFCCQEMCPKEAIRAKKRLSIRF